MQEQLDIVDLGDAMTETRCSLTSGSSVRLLRTDRVTGAVETQRTGVQATAHPGLTGTGSDAQSESSVPDIGTNKKKEFWMPPHTRVCVTATGAVLLDLKRNRYFGLGYREARSLSALATNWSAASTPADAPLEPMPLDDAARLADALVKAGFLTAGRSD